VWEKGRGELGEGERTAVKDGVPRPSIRLPAFFYLSDVLNRTGTRDIFLAAHLTENRYAKPHCFVSMRSHDYHSREILRPSCCFQTTTAEWYAERREGNESLRDGIRGDPFQVVIANAVVHPLLWVLCCHAPAVAHGCAG